MRPHRRKPTRVPHPWDSPGKNTGVGCHFLLRVSIFYRVPSSRSFQHVTKNCLWHDCCHHLPITVGTSSLNRSSVFKCSKHVTSFQPHNNWVIVQSGNHCTSDDKTEAQWEGTAHSHTVTDERASGSLAAELKFIVSTLWSSLLRPHLSIHITHNTKDMGMKNPHPLKIILMWLQVHTELYWHTACENLPEETCPHSTLIHLCSWKPWHWCLSKSHERYVRELCFHQKPSKPNWMIFWVLQLTSPTLKYWFLIPVDRDKKQKNPQSIGEDKEECFILKK